MILQCVQVQAERGAVPLLGSCMCAPVMSLFFCQFFGLPAALRAGSPMLVSCKNLIAGRPHIYIYYTVLSIYHIYIYIHNIDTITRMPLKKGEKKESAPSVACRYYYYVYYCKPPQWPLKKISA